METAGIERDEPLTPAGRLFLRPETEQIIHCIIGVKNPIDVDSFTSEVNKSLLIKHPRFTSLMVTDNHGRERWRKTQIQIHRHIIVRDDPVGEGDDPVNNYVADLAVSTPLSTDKPLWEIHCLRAHNCFVFRIHHALGDGISLMSLMLSCCRRADDMDQMPTISAPASSSPPPRIPVGRLLWRLMQAVCLTAFYVLQLLLRVLWVKDRRTAVSGGAGVELWPRKLATAKFSLEHMKAAKKSVPGATINDVLFAIISCGLSTYLDTRSSKDLQEGLQLTGLAMVNLRKQPGLQDLSDLMKGGNSGSRWGNQFGMVLLPVYYHHPGRGDPLHYLKRSKKMLDKKKLSLEAYFSYKIGYLLMSLFGAKFASWLNYRIVCNTTFTFSNVVGPREEIIIAGNPATYIRVTSTGLSHAITMHMVSYAGKAEMQILVAKDIIPDPEVLAKCFEDALIRMKDAAEATRVS